MTDRARLADPAPGGRARRLARRGVVRAVGPVPLRAVATADENSVRKSTGHMPRPAQSDEDLPPPISEIDRNDVMAAIRELFLDGQSRDRDDAIRDIARAQEVQALANAGQIADSRQIRSVQGHAAENPVQRVIAADDDLDGCGETGLLRLNLRWRMHRCRADRRRR